MNEQAAHTICALLIQIHYSHSTVKDTELRESAMTHHRIQAPAPVCNPLRFTLCPGGAPNRGAGLPWRCMFMGWAPPGSLAILSGEYLQRRSAECLAPSKCSGNPNYSTALSLFPRANMKAPTSPDSGPTSPPPTPTHREKPPI